MIGTARLLGDLEHFTQDAKAARWKWKLLPIKFLFVLHDRVV